MSVNKHSKKDRGKRKLVWNFNDPSGWEKYHKITSSDRSLLQCWQNNNDPEMNYGIWSKKVNVILRECFKKRHIRNDKLLYTKEIRSLIKERKAVKKHIKICIRPLCKGRHKFKKLDSLINRKIAHFNDDIIRQKVGSDGSISKQDFWKIKRVLAPKCNTVPHCIINNFGNEITDEGSICEEYRREFIHRLRKREIEDDLKDYELLNNTLCKKILQNAKSNISSGFTLQELGDVLKELKRGKCMNPAGLIREMFIYVGQMLTQTLLAMTNSNKNKARTPLQWNQM